MDLLSEWEKYARLYSSDLSIYPKRYNRDTITNVVSTLKSLRSDIDFEKEIHYDTQLSKIYWIRSLLMNKENFGSISAIIELSKLINFIKNNYPSIYHGLRHEGKCPETFRSFMYEVYVYNLLHINSVFFEPKITENNKMPEGKLKFNDEDIIFECSRMNTPEADKIYQLRTASYRLMNELKKQPYGKSIIFAISYPNEKVNYNRTISEVKPLLSEYYKCCRSGQIFKYTYSDNDIDICAHETSTLEGIKIDLNKSEHDIVTKIYPSSTSHSHKKNLHRVISSFSPTIKAKNINNNLINKIRSKIRQLKDFNERKVIFIDYEIIEEISSLPFKMAGTKIINIQQIKDEINKHKSDIVVCITVRNYLNYNPTLRLITFSNNNNSDLEHYIKSLMHLKS